jgi:hypothetical protein
LRYPGESVPELPAWHRSSGFTTAFRHPRLDSTRFSLNGVSSVRAYDPRSTVFVRLMLYDPPSRGSAWFASLKPL